MCVSGWKFVQKKKRRWGGGIKGGEGLNSDVWRVELVDLSSTDDDWVNFRATWHFDGRYDRKVWMWFLGKFCV